MFDYFRDGSWALQRVWFEALAGSYSGRGLLKWSPDMGFHLDAFVDRPSPIPSTIHFGKPRVLGPHEKRHVRVRFAPGVRGISSQIVVTDQLELISDNRLEVDFPGLLEVSRRSQASTDRHVGRAILATGKDMVLPDSVTRQSTVADRVVRQEFTLSAIDYEDESLRVCALVEQGSYVRLEWSLRASDWSKQQAWGFANAFALALSIVAGETVQVVERTCMRGEREYCERWRRHKTTKLDFLRPMPGHDIIPKELLIRLLRAFLTDARCADISRRTLDQLAEAARQQTHAGRELLCGTILEAILRTIDARPFIPADNSWDWSRSLENFRDKYLGAKWHKAIERVKEAFKRLRHRNAHPDWLTAKNGTFASPSLEQSLDDVVFLSTFYGYVIQALAGCPELEPRFLKPMKDWNALIIVTTGASEQPPSQDA